MLAIVALGTGLTFVMFGISSFLIFRSVGAGGASAWAPGTPQPVALGQAEQGRMGA